MPELPELRLAAQFITRVCKTLVFANPPTKSVVSVRQPDVLLPFACFRIAAVSRGKELLLTCTSAAKSGGKGPREPENVSILFRFGMVRVLCGGCLAFARPPPRARFRSLSSPAW